VYRAGIWKPRTSPHSFQGIGDEGLRWLSRVQEETGLKCATEVATAEQVHTALDAGITHLWIGARTTANPIQTQVLADTMDERVEWVAVKNPVNEDAALWVGDIERFLSRGLQVLAIHRGCNHRPCWGMAYHLRQQLPPVPLLLDPSHMSGDRQKIASLMAQAEHLGYNGYMIEVHPQPELALSDSGQQLTPETASALLSVNDNANENHNANDLVWLRAMMDEVDDELWATIAKRMDVSRMIGRYKQEEGMEIVQPKRYEEIVKRRLNWAQEHQLSPEAIKTIMDALHHMSIDAQR